MLSVKLCDKLYLSYESSYTHIYMQLNGSSAAISNSKEKIDTGSADILCDFVSESKGGVLYGTERPGTETTGRSSRCIC